MTTPRVIRGAIALRDGLLDLLWPMSCPLCGEFLSAGEVGVYRAPGGFSPPLLHAACLAQLPRAPLPRGQLWGGPRLPVHWYYRDSPAYFRLLHAAKYGGRPALLGPSIAKWAEQLRPRLTATPRPLLVPLPDDPKRRRQRGFSLTALLAAAMGQTLDLPWRQDLLTKRIETAPQARLRAEDRGSALSGVFGVGRLYEISRQTPLLLIDDQVTTGSTLSEAASLLGARGNLVGGLALAGASGAPGELALDTRPVGFLESP